MLARTLKNYSNMLDNNNYQPIQIIERRGTVLALDYSSTAV